MTEHEHYEGDREFTPAIDPEALYDPNRPDRQPVNETPIELTEEEYAMMRMGGAHSEEVKAFMETRQIPYDQVLKFNIDGKIVAMTTKRTDFMTRLLGYDPDRSRELGAESGE
jgi:hypothetical protein